MKTFLALIGAVVVVGFACLFFLGVLGGVATHSTNTSPEDSPVQPVNAPQQTISAIPVSAMELYVAYHRNEVAADARFKDKVLMVDGIVTSINKNALDEMYLTLATGNEFSPVDAKLKASEASWAAGLEIGHMVTVRCVGGTMIIGTPVLEECVPEQSRQASPGYTPRPSNSDEPVQSPTEAPPQVPLQTAVYATPAASQLTVDQYEDSVLQQMKTHWILPPGTPPDTRAGISVDIAPDGRIYGATIQQASTWPALDRSCLDALNQMSHVDPTPDGKVLQISFDCTSK